MSEKQRVAVCIPSGETWTAPMAFQALCLSIYSTEHVHVMPVLLSGDDTAQARNRLVRMARRAGADWLLWIDNDMVFPPDSLVRLMNHNLDIVGVDYRRRAPPFQRVGLFLRDEDRPAVPRAQAEIAEGGLIEMAVIGLGLVLIKVDVFNVLSSPWFARTWAREHFSFGNPDGFSTEDSYFCYTARKMGYHIWCDLDLSREIQHVGQAVVPFDLPDAGLPDHPALPVPA